MTTWNTVLCVLRSSYRPHVIGVGKGDRYWCKWMYTSIYSLLYSHTHGWLAHCTWWHNVNVIEGEERGTNLFTIFCYDYPVEDTSLHICTKTKWNISTSQYLNPVSLWNLPQFLIQGTTKKPAERGTILFTFLCYNHNVEDILLHISTKKNWIEKKILPGNS